MDDWTTARSTWLREDAHERGREDALDARRRSDALVRADAAYDKARRDERSERPAVVALRQEWARTRIARELEARGFDVTGCDDGADALGTTAALQPVLLVCEEPLASVATHDLIAWARRLSPESRVVVQVQHTDDVASAIAAGAAVAVPRTTALDELVRLALP